MSSITKSAANTLVIFLSFERHSTVERVSFKEKRISDSGFPFYAADPSRSSSMTAKYRFNVNDRFYLCAPLCGLIHYRYGAIIAGLGEIVTLGLAVASFVNLHHTKELTALWTLLFAIGLLVGASITTCIMFYGLKSERPSFLQPQLYFLSFEIAVMIGMSILSIASMSLGIDMTSRIFSPFVNVKDMEFHFGPIWPFCIAIVAFTCAALGIWFHLTVDGAREYLLDKKYFDHQENDNLPLELKNKAEEESQRASNRA
ncbi:unnamed protein product [Bursaphelenchus okinawaensis]|uniref:Uncharacterized protein n=1 Tax=Bursaphelenchus okinawaensis TaxID=465554 RepID=A0A811JS39_9BILA|nr:unnamed protein product [Bursaphelenchus okinawaensis]CAG9080556.1 unnamed protein product [Bursaphelenchus okinawaensis]